jgi:hypothetical protein
MPVAAGGATHLKVPLWCCFRYLGSGLHRSRSGKPLQYYRAERAKLVMPPTVPVPLFNTESDPMFAVPG